MATRYQVNTLGWTLALANHNCVPAMRGYLQEAQLNLIEKLKDHRLWSYWWWENLGGRHPIPTMEAGELPGWRDRPLRRVVAGGIEARGEVRTRYTHATDITPTVLPALGIGAPPDIAGVGPEHFRGPFRFTGRLRDVVLDIKGEAITNTETELLRIFAQQRP
jgi:hypothetical protein